MALGMDSLLHTVADKEKFPFLLRATPFRFCSVPFYFFRCVKLRSVAYSYKGGQTYNTSSLKFLYVAAIQSRNSLCAMVECTSLRTATQSSPTSFHPMDRL